MSVNAFGGPSNGVENENAMASEETPMSSYGIHQKLTNFMNYVQLYVTVLNISRRLL